MTGQTISHYKVLAKISEDSTGTFFKAVDTATDRGCTIRTLTAEAANNRTLRDRIVRDATAASALQHPNITHIREWSGEAGLEFAVIEAAEGESLWSFLERERPNRRNLLRFTAQIASALAAAHSANLVHGPLNPAAIFVTPTSDIKFFDFGFGALDSPPESEDARRALFGEAAPYVSPEQAQGNPADMRSDIFSYGALAYHMTTGRSPFQAATIAESWKAIVRSEPKPVAKLTSRAPRGMDKLIERCLRKDPRRRFETIAEIEPLIEKMADAYRLNPEQTNSFLSRYGGWIAKIAAVGLVAAALIAASLFWWRSRTPKEQVLGAHLRQITHDGGLDSAPALSADGSRIVYAADRGNSGNLDIWTQSTDGGEPLRLTNDPADDDEPDFSPGGGTIVFRSERNGGGVYVVPSTGGQARLIAPEGRRPRYSPDGKWIAYWIGPPGLAPKAAGAYKIFVVSSSGGEPRQIQPEFASSKNPVWSPDSKRLLFLGRADATLSDPNGVDWWVAPIDGGAPVNTGACQLFRRAGVLSPFNAAIPGDWKENHIFYSVPLSDGSNVWRAEISQTSSRVETPPVKVTNGKGIEILPSAARGLVAFSEQSFNSDIWSVPLAANEGRVTGSLKRRTSDPANDVSPSLSRDGSKLAYQSNRSGHYNVMLLDLKSGKESALAASPDEQYWPLISPDGSRVAWSETRINRYEQLYRSPGGASCEALCEDCGPAVSAWSHDGAFALVDSSGAKPRIAVQLIKLKTGSRTPVLEDANANLRQARFSPDDRSIAFRATRDGGTTRLYVAPFRDQAPTPAQEWVALTDGTGWESSPQWSPDGNLIYYVSTRDGFHCVWAQRLDSSRKPTGAPFAVLHLHTARLAPVSLPMSAMDLWIGHDQILLSLGELTGNIWTARVN